MEINIKKKTDMADHVEAIIEAIMEEETIEVATVTEVDQDHVVAATIDIMEVVLWIDLITEAVEEMKVDSETTEMISMAATEEEVMTITKIEIDPKVGLVEHRTTKEAFTWMTSTTDTEIDHLAIIF
jgi:hypothetical protein